MFEYLKAVFKRNGETLQHTLTKEQKTKYRKQYLSNLTSGLLYTIVYLGSIVTLIVFFFEKQFWTLAIIITLARDYARILQDLKDEIELIEQRIQKRSKKNLKQNRGENNAKQ